MRLFIILSIMISALLVVISAPVISSDNTYKTPDWRDIVAEKVPLRVLIAGHQQSFGWKSDDAVTVADKNNKLLFNCTTAHNYSLEKIDNFYKVRRDGVSVIRVSGEIILTGKKMMTFTCAAGNCNIDAGTPVSIVIDGTFHASRLIYLENYTRLVSQGEIPRKFPREVLRAHAVLARTYPLTKLGKHADEYADVCATIDCQTCAYTKSPGAEWDEAVNATHGIFLADNAGLPADAYYSNSCGGSSDDAGYIWGPEYARPYLRPVSDAKNKTTTYCADDPKYTWERKYTIGQVNKLVAANLPIINNDPTAVIKNVTDIHVEMKSPGGRAYITRIEGDNSSLIVRTEAIRWLFGSGKPGHDGLPSALFDITPQKDAAGKLTGFNIKGRGFGHGIGMCLWGAVGRAKTGKNYRSILHTYFPTALLSDEK